MPHFFPVGSHSLGPVRSRGPRALSAVAAVALVATVGLPQSAVAAESSTAAPVPSTVVIPLGDPESSIFAEYGRAPAQPIQIGAATSVIVIQPELESTDSGVRCFVSIGDVFAERSYSQAEWNTGRIEIAVTPTAGGPSDGLSCYSDTFDIRWYLTSTSTAATRVVLTQGEEFLTGWDDEQTYLRYENAGTIGIGDTVQVVGDPGTWPDAADPASTFGASLFVRDPRGAGADLTDYSVSPDGSVLTIQIPDTLPPRLWGQSAYLGGGVTTTSTSSPLRTMTTSFEFSITVAADRTSKTRLTPLPPVTLTTLTTRALVRLSSPGLTDVSGKLTLVIDGSETQFIFVKPRDHSRVTFTLPRLPKGNHRITISFEGDPRGVAGSSATANLRVLR